MLTIYNNSVNHSEQLKNYISDSVAMTLDQGDIIYFGYYKPINAVYLDLETTQTDTTNIVLKYYNGAWVSVNISDETNALKRSGFITWKRNIDGQIKSIVSGDELFWYQIIVHTSQAVNIDFNGINLVFSNDNDLKEEYPSIMDHLPDGTSSFIGFHQSSRNDIIKNLSNREEVLADDNLLKQLDQFDLLDRSEVKDASKYLVLAKIFSWLSDAVDDKWFQKSKMFMENYANCINSFRFSIDKNDNGKTDDSEKLSISTIRVVRE